MCYGWDRGEVQIGFWLGNLREDMGGRVILK